MDGKTNAEVFGQMRKLAICYQIYYTKRNMEYFGHAIQHEK